MTFFSSLLSSWFPGLRVAAELAALAAFLLVLVLRPRLLLLPVIYGFAAWSWVKIWLSFPGLLREYLAAATLAKNASALESHAKAAQALWGANTEYRPAAREVYARVVAGYGIAPPGQMDGEKGDDDDRPLRAVGDPFAAQQVAGAAAAVGGSVKAKATGNS